MFCVALYVFCLLVVLVRFSVPVQVIRLGSEMTNNVLMMTMMLTLLTHALATNSIMKVCEW